MVSRDNLRKRVRAARADADLSPAKRHKIMAGRDIREIVRTVAVTRKALNE